VWSPDGGHFAFVRVGAKKKNELWIARADGTGPQRIAAIQGRDHPPRWSPDGQQLLFVQTIDKTPALYVVARSGGKPTRIAGDGITCAAWRPAPRKSKTQSGR
jgi:TolB protein